MSMLRFPSRRKLCAWILAALSLATALEIHPAAEARLESAAAGQTLAVPAAAHPVTSTHIEASTLVEVPLCPACMLRLQTRGLHLAAVAQVALPSLSARIVTAASRPHEWQPSRPSSARAPPLA